MSPTKLVDDLAPNAIGGVVWEFREGEHTCLGDRKSFQFSVVSYQLLAVWGFREGVHSCLGLVDG